MSTLTKQHPLIGRSAELKQLQGALQDALNRRGSVWLIGGGEGVGKSHLLNELIQHAQALPVSIFTGQDVEEGGLPFQCWGQIISAMSFETVVDDFEASVLKDIVPELNTLLERDIPEISLLEPRTHQQRINTVVSDVVRHYASPTLLVLEDIHWSQVNLEPLKLMARFVETLPMLIVATYRDDIRPELPDMLTPPGNDSNMKRITLSAFSRDEVASLCHEVYADFEQLDRIIQPFYAETEGNPLLVTEGLAYLKSKYTDPGQFAGEVLPEGIQTLVDYQLELMPESYRAVLYAAAVGGVLIDLVILNDLHGQYGDGEFSLRMWLDMAARSGWIELTVNGQWRFCSDRLRRALVERIEEGRLKLLHTRIAELLQSHYFHELNLYSAFLTDHYSHTDDWEREQYFAYLAGRTAASFCADDLALKFLNKALWLSNDDETIKLLEINLLLESIYHRLGRRDLQTKTISALESLVVQAQSNTYTVRVGLRRAHYAHRLGQDGIALETVRQTAELARAYEMLAEEAEAHYCWGQIYVRLKDFDTARSHFQNAFNLAQESDDDTIETLTLRALGSIALDEGNFDEATENYGRSLHLAHEIGDRMGKGMALNNLGEVARYQRDFQMARTYCEQSLKIFHEIGYVRGEVFLLYNLGLATCDLGDYSSSLRYYEEGLVLSRRIQDRYNEGWALLGMGQVYNRLGQYGLAHRQLERALLIFHEIQQKDAESWVYAAMSTLALNTGQLEEAVNNAEQALQLAREDGHSILQARALMRLGHAQVGLSQADKAVGNFQQSAGIYQTQGELHLAAEATAGIARAMMMMQDFQEAARYTETVINYLLGNSLDGVDDPLQTYLICYRVLELRSDPRSAELLANAIEVMQEQESLIVDPAFRESFNNEVPSNRALMQSWNDLNARTV